MINRPPPRKLLVVLSFYDGDREQMETLCRLIADIEPVKNLYADILLYRRSDAADLSLEVRSCLLSKFNKVHSLKCRRLNSHGYPLGCNEMFYDLLEMMRAPQWTQSYYAFYNMESDVVPLAVNWIQQLADEYKKTMEDGVLAIGHVCEKPVQHLNGASIFATDFFNRAGGNDLLGGPCNIAYDFYHAKRIMAVGRDSSLMALDFNRKTITSDDLFTLRKNGVAPVVFHGVKDQSALIAVRSKLVDRNASIQDLSGSTIFTYFEPNPGFNEETEREALSLWKSAWANAGWNPVVHERRDAQKNPAYQAVFDKISKLKGVRHNSHDIICYMRWLALEYAGGGLHCDYDVLPRPDLHPEQFKRQKGLCVYQSVGRRPAFSMFSAERDKIALMWTELARPGHKAFEPECELIEAFTFTPYVKNIGEKGWEKAKCVHFSPAASTKFNPGAKRSSLMGNFLDGKIEVRI